ncbi:hypothetical protein [Arthrobacter bambusae]|uniref:Uncharacterized protein n=1 Tax=Arthrobacter bambusae TaxID=1338426 RepID=A0AAW8DAI9_9MICC|nr:hypothetical protein [Arthrobacter bambusae]MDP9904745.1 hypothetical protein [Arthrobacter bambusae]MDQ0129561.1 hypothetical protein [Arthrobacter bambusae]MDQ0180826.1 hypothetical protein [Arthrobacter bambusae]
MTQSSDLRARLLTAIQSREHKEIVFHDLDQVPVGSSGYFSPSGQSATRGPYGWVSHDISFAPRDNQVFTSHHGPANDEKLAELLEATLVPENTILVSFEAVTDSESDWDNETLVSQPLDPFEHAGPFRVSWEIDSDEDISPARAAANVWTQSFNRGTDQPSPDDACVFTVTDSKTGTNLTIDLSDPTYAGLFN